MIRFLMRVTVVAQAVNIGVGYGLGKFADLLGTIYALQVGADVGTATTTGERSVTYAKSEAN